jgi:hypothetical protein
MSDVADGAQPSVMDLGGGRKLSISADSLELQGGPESTRIPIAALKRISLVQRRVWFFGVAAILGAVFAGIVASTPARVLVGAIAALQLWMWFRMREFAMQADLKSGSSEHLPLGRGGGERAAQIQAVWSRASAELGRRGVEVG